MAEKQETIKKKVLFVLPDYCHGGTNKSMESLLQFLDKEKFDISVYVLYVDGGKYYRGVYLPYILGKSLIYYLAHDNVVTRKVMGALMKLSKRVNFNWLYRYEVNRLQKKYRFDTIVAYQETTPTKFVSLLRSPCNKVAWVHCDYADHYRITGGADELEDYSRYNHIVCVSHTTLQTFTNIYPQLSDRCTYIYNTIVKEAINRLADSDEGETGFDASCFNIVSVGRFSEVKQFNKIPEICRQLKRLSDKRFCWYIIGDGDRKLIGSTIEKIEHFNLQGEVVLLGSKDNPYPYIKQADLLVSTSYSEACPYVIAEAKALHTPVLANDYPVASEVVPPESGWICPIADMPQLLAKLIEDKDGIYSQVKQSPDNGLPDNGDIARKVEALL